MSEEPRVWPVIMVAGLMVVSIGAGFVIGGENETDGPGLPVGQDIWMTYQVTGLFNGTEVDGTYECFIHKWENSGWSGGIGYNFTGNSEVVRTILPKVLVWGSYVDDSEIDTPWGIKEVQRCIYVYPSSGQQGVFISYTGSHTNLEYQVNFISSNARINFELMEIEVEDMDAYDLTPASDSDLLAESRHANDFSGTSGPYSYLLIEPREDEYYKIYINSTSAAIIVMEEEDIYKMIEGGEYQYRSGWSVFGNGSREFNINEGLAFFICYPLNLDLQGTRIQVDVDVFER